MGPQFLRRIVFSDECVFYVFGIANNKNARFWETKNPRLVQEYQLHSPKITVWCGIHANRDLDPHWFDNKTVRGADYNELLNTYVSSSSHLFPQNYLFEQDGAAPHTSNVDPSLFDSLFPDSWIGKHCPYNRHARSPNLSSPDFSF